MSPVEERQSCKADRVVYARTTGGFGLGFLDESRARADFDSLDEEWLLHGKY
jgi:hypothetical protein